MITRTQANSLVDQLALMMQERATVRHLIRTNPNVAHAVVVLTEAFEEEMQREEEEG